MTQTTDNNKLIAQFMGLNEPFELPQFGTIRPNGDFKTEFTAEQLKYNKSFDWIMPVVKLCKERQVFGSNNLINDIDRALLHVDLEQINKAVIEFINYYNENK